MSQQHQGTLPSPEHLLGCLLGTAVGDALGLPREGLQPARAQRRFGTPDRYRFLGSKGFVSDDTDHACLVAWALARAKGDASTFETALASGLRCWLLTMPPGVGYATLRACLKLSVGFSARSSGVWSAGNGPAMRSALIGVIARDERHLSDLVRVSTQITHTDPKAFHAAHAVALSARLASRERDVAPRLLHEYLHAHAEPGAEELLSLIDRAVDTAAQRTSAFADSLGISRGVTGYAYHTVPVCIHAWFTNQGVWLDAVRSAIECGGDADTTGAITGAIAGAQLGADAIPTALRDNLVSWPYSIAWMRDAADALASGVPLRRASHLAALLRNAATTAVVFGHIARRMLPPY